jgi:SAM-dependent methyltransferase
MMMSQKFDLQDNLYSFPYHYLPTINEDGVIQLHQHLSWGLEYLTYMTFIVALIKERQPGSLLDVGCGDGRLLSMLRGAISEMRGVDVSQRAIALAQAMNPDLDFVCEDVAEIMEIYQMITLVEVLEHIPDDIMPGFMENIAQRVAPSGQLLVSVPTVNVPLNQKHYRHYNLEQIQAAIDPHFIITQHWWVYRRGNLIEWLSRRLLCNGLFVLNQRHLSALIWRWHKRLNYLGSEKNGGHLIVLASPRR